MCSKDRALVFNKVDVPMDRVCLGKKTRGKVPKRIHKAVREKKKRLDQQNTGKATILSEATRLLKDFLGQIESLRNQNVSLLSESNYMALEKNELREDTSALETQIERLQSELRDRMIQSKPDLNVPPAEVAFHFLPHLQTNQPLDAAQLTAQTSSNVSKPMLGIPPRRILGHFDFSVSNQQQAKTPHRLIKVLRLCNSKYITSNIVLSFLGLVYNAP